MRRRTLVIAVSLCAIVGLTLAGALVPAAGRDLQASNRFAPSGAVSVNPITTPLVGARSSAAAARAAAAIQSTTSGGCVDPGANVRVNQECTNQSAPGFFGRSQSQNETAVAVNPLNPKNVVASQNDYRRGDGTCGTDWSNDGGRKWGSTVAPIGFTAPGFTAARHYWDAGGDPSSAFDSSGEAYLMCLAFNRGVTSDLGGDGSGIFLFRSGDGGASWSFPGSPVATSDGTGADGIGLLDKPYMAIDISAASPYRDRIYVSWSNYSTDFSADPIYLAYSEDHGVTWHQTGAISGFSTDLCPINFSGATSGTCDANQFSDPFTAPNGDVYVVFQNFNNCNGAFGDPCTGDPNDNHNQMLVVKSTDGGNTFGDPVKVTDFYDLPDCFTYTGFDFGRACVPTAPLSGVSIFRATNYPSGAAVSNTEIVVDFGSYLNQHSNPVLGNCSPAGLSGDTFLNLYDGVGEVNGCNNDVVRSVSTDGGATFTGTSTDVSELPSVSSEGQQLADQWWQWSALTPRGKVATVYYDRRFGNNMATGFMDISLFKGFGTPVRVTNVSFPSSNEFPDVNGASTFMGDYTGLAVGSDGIAHPVWTDARNPIFTFSTAPGDDARTLVPAGFGSDIYTAAIRT